MNQKKIFLKSEGDRYYERNKNIISQNHNFICKKIIELSKSKSKLRILEIGCGAGNLLKKIHEKKKNFKLFGIDPSIKAIKANKNLNISLKKGTADALPYKDKSFDLVIYGFCLYLVDKELLFKVVNEANRVLKLKGNVAIFDFYSKKSILKNYRHNRLIKSHKMDFSKLFLSHPFYKLIYRKIGDHKNIQRKSKSTKNTVSFFIIKKDAK